MRAVDQKPGYNLEWSHGVFGHCIALDQQRHSAGSSAKICTPWLAFLKSQKGGVQQNWRRQELSVQDGCVHWGARVVVPPPGSPKIASNSGTTWDKPRHCKDEKLGKKLCVLGEP